MRHALLAFLFLFSPALTAGDDHDLTTIKGPNIDLQFLDHAIAGSVNGKLVYGGMFNGKFGSKVTVREDRATEYSGQFIIPKNKKKPIGVLKTEDEKTTTIEFVSYDNKEHKMYMLFNGEEVTVDIEYDKIDGKHYINPKFSLDYKGKLIWFKVADGSACPGCIMNILFMIMGPYIH